MLLSATLIFLQSYSDNAITPTTSQTKQRSIQTTPSTETAKLKERVKTIYKMNGFYIPHKTSTYRCGKHTCKLEDGSTNSAAADLALFGEIDVHRFENPPTKRPQQLWAFFAKEPQIWMENRRSQMKWNGLFNYSATFLRHNEGNQHVFRSDSQRKSAPDKQYFTPKPNMRPLRALWFVSHCTTPTSKHRVHSAREEYVLELSKYVTIDIFTSPEKHHCRNRFGNLIESGSTETEPKMEDYMFYLSFENNLCQDYVTEKLWKVLESNSTTIPIALGGLSIEDYELVAPSNSFIHVKNFTSPEILAKHLKFVSEDDNAFHYYNQWRNEYRLITHRTRNNKSGDFMCYFCHLLHERPQNIWDTFSEDYGPHQCRDVSEPQAYQQYYNLSKDSRH